MDVVPHITPTDGTFAAPRPGSPTHEPIPGGNIPTEIPPGEPDELPDTGPSGPRSPYPVNDPGISDPGGPGSEPDYLPGKPLEPDAAVKVSGRRARRGCRAVN